METIIAGIISVAVGTFFVWILMGGGNADEWTYPYINKVSLPFQPNTED